MSDIDILNIVYLDIIKYTFEIEKILLERCEKAKKGVEYLDYNIHNTPFECILRLREHGKITNINVYSKYFGYNILFDYVCFPEKFDYNNFDVERLYTWLQIEPYKSIAKEKATGIMKQKFKNAIRVGTREEVRAIYYKHFYDEDNSK